MNMLNTRRLAVLLLGFLSIIRLGQAQHTLRIEVNDFLGAENIFLSGSINQWNPKDKNYQLKRINYFRTEITLHNLPAGQYTFKLNDLYGRLRVVQGVEGEPDKGIEA